MKQCPKCGKRFNWWQRATGESREHVRSCCYSKAQVDEMSLSQTCRGCPAGCFEETYGQNDK